MLPATAAVTVSTCFIACAPPHHTFSVPFLTTTLLLPFDRSLSPSSLQLVLPHYILLLYFGRHLLLIPHWFFCPHRIATTTTTILPAWFTAFSSLPLRSVFHCRTRWTLPPALRFPHLFYTFVASDTTGFCLRRIHLHVPRHPRTCFFCCSPAVIYLPLHVTYACRFWFILPLPHSYLPACHYRIVAIGSPYLQLSVLPPLPCSPLPLYCHLPTIYLRLLVLHGHFHRITLCDSLLHITYLPVTFTPHPCPSACLHRLPCHTYLLFTFCVCSTRSVRFRLVHTRIHRLVFCLRLHCPPPPAYTMCIAHCYTTYFYYRYCYITVTAHAPPLPYIVHGCL